MQIMCLNGWGGKLHDFLLPFLEENPPDVLCLQEVVHSQTTQKSWLTYRDGEHILSQRANFFRDVCTALPNHFAVFCPAAQGELWDGETSVPSQWGLATFVHSDLTVVGQIQGFVHKGFSPFGYGDHPRSRSAHGIRVYDYATKRFVSIVHMHGLRDLRGKIDTPERMVQAKRLLDLCKNLSEPGDLSVICGDFNVEPRSETLRILSQEGYSDLVTSHGFLSTRTSYYKKHSKYADYMLVSKPEAVVSFSVLTEPEVSDHCPLVLII